MAIALVQKAAGLSGGGASFGQAYGSNNTAGNLLICLTRAFSGILLAAVNPITDSQGNTWSLAKSVVLTGQDTYYIYYAPNCKAGANTVTVTYASSTFPIALIAEYSGVATVSPLDQVASAIDLTGSSTAYNSGPVTTTTANQLLVGLFGNQSGAATTVTPDAGWISENQERSGTVPDLMLLDQIVSSISAYSNSGTLNAGRTWGAGIATFKGAIAPPPPSSGGSWIQFGRDFINKRGLRG